MAMGTRKHRQRQEPLWYRAELAEAPGHPFYQRLNRVLEEADFDRFCESMNAGAIIDQGAPRKRRFLAVQN